LWNCGFQGKKQKRSKKEKGTKKGQARKLAHCVPIGCFMYLFVIFC